MTDLTEKQKIIRDKIGNITNVSEQARALYGWEEVMHLSSYKLITYLSELEDQIAELKKLVKPEKDLEWQKTPKSISEEDAKFVINQLYEENSIKFKSEKQIVLEFLKKYEDDIKKNIFNKVSTHYDLIRYNDASKFITEHIMKDIYKVIENVND